MLSFCPTRSFSFSRTTLGMTILYPAVIFVSASLSPWCSIAPHFTPTAQSRRAPGIRDYRISRGGRLRGGRSCFLTRDCGAMQLLNWRRSGGGGAYGFEADHHALIHKEVSIPGLAGAERVGIDHEFIGWAATGTG